MAELFWKLNEDKKSGGKGQNNIWIMSLSLYGQMLLLTATSIIIKIPDTTMMYIPHFHTKSPTIVASYLSVITSKMSISFQFCKIFNSSYLTFRMVSNVAICHWHVFKELKMIVIYTQKNEYWKCRKNIMKWNQSRIL